MIDMDIVGMNWIQIPADKYKLRRESQKVSTCQFEFDIMEFLAVEPIPLNVNSKLRH